MSIPNPAGRAAIRRPSPLVPSARRGLGLLARGLATTGLLLGSLSAQAPVTDTLVADINTGPPWQAESSLPQLLGAGSGVAWFSAESAATGRELWVTDGTPVGTTALGDLLVGPASSEPSGAVVLPSGRLLFRATADGVGREPHIAVPGAPAAQLLVDLEPGTEGSLPSNAVLWQGEAWFAATTAARGRELWRSDGTAAGTRPGGDIIPGPDSVPIDDFRIHVAGNQLYFVANTFASQVWVKPSPTAPARPVTPLSFSFRSTRWYGVEVGGKLMFPLAPAGLGQEPEPWVTDGTAAGTVMLGDLTPGLGGTDVQIMASDGQRVWFRAETPVTGAELWMTDGTPGGTRLVVDLVAGPGGSVPTMSVAALLPGGDLIYTAYDGPGTGSELWRSDGTAAGTRLIADLAPGVDSSFPSGIRYFAGALWFQAWSQQHGRELWRYDPVSGQATRMTDLMPGVAHSDSQALAELPGGRVLFAGRDPRHGLEPRVITSTPGSDQLLADVRADDNADSNPRHLMRYRGLLVFQANDDVHGVEPWVSDGTTAGTRMLVDLEPGQRASYPVPLASLPSGLVFTAARGQSQQGELWVTDGTPAGTRLVVALGSTGTVVPVTASQRLGDRLVFASVTPSFRVDLWVTDGTASGTSRIAGWTDLYDAKLFASSGGRVYGAARRDINDEELLVSDGTAAGTALIDILPGQMGSFPLRMAAVRDGVVFTPFEPVDGVELWFAGGQPLRVQRITDMGPGPIGTRVSAIVSLGDIAVFTAQDPFTFDYAFWRSDGTVAGTRPFAAGLPADLGNRAARLTVAGDHAFFWSRPTVTSQTELWITDGTTAGTRQVSASPGPSNYFGGAFLSPVGDGRHVAFQQYDPALGRELWISDGTAAGTRPLTDTAPGPGDSTPGSVTRVAGRILFSADDARTGIELHAVDLADTGAWVASVYGAGCGASIAPSGAPTLGGRLDVHVGTGSFAVVALLFAEAPAWQPLAGGCLLHLDQPFTLAATRADPGGAARFGLPVPNLPVLAGGLLHLQAFAAVPGGPLLGALEGTPGLEVVVGR